MEELFICGGKRLNGGVPVHGAKNSALPILAAAVACDGESVLHNVPRLSDVEETLNVLRYLGCEVRREGKTVVINAKNAGRFDVPKEKMQEMRSSIIFMGAFVSRFGQAELFMPGGCKIGDRPIELHVNSLRHMGLQIEIDEKKDSITCFAPRPLTGCELMLEKPSVGATENILIAAATAKGVTVIQNAAREPEIADLADFLNAAGAKIRGAGERVIVVEGVERLFGTEHTVIPDRITASTYMAAGAVTGGKVTLLGVLPAHLKPVFPAFLKAGCDIALCGNELTVTPPAKLRPVGDVVTDYYPGFPTDSQPPVLAMAALAVGSSEFTENIFEKRLNHTQELIKMGADIKVTKNMARINGVGRLCGCPVKAEDLRGGAALIVAALAAQGETQIGGMEYILRGYEDIELSLGHLGANIWLKESKLEEEKAVGSK